MRYTIPPRLVALVFGLLLLPGGHSEIKRAYQPSDSFLVASNHSWNQWVAPIAVHSDSITAFTGIGGSGQVQVSTYRIGSDTVRSFTVDTIGADDHNAPAILPPRVGTDEGWLLVYTNHGTNNVHQYRRSDGPDDLSSWGQKHTIEWPKPVTYTQLVRRESQVFLFARQRPGFAFVRSTDGGYTWKSPHRWVTGHKWLYALHRLAPGGRRMYVALYEHPSKGGLHNIYVGIINLASGEIFGSRGRVLGNMYDPSTLPVRHTDFEMAYEADDEKTTRLLDLSKWGDIFFATWSKDSFSDAQYHVRRANGTTATLGAAGRPLDYDSESHHSGGHPRGYLGGGTFDLTKRDVLYLSREHRGQWRIERVQSEDGFESWSRDALSPRSTIKAARPIAVKHATAALPCVWIQGRYDEYENYATDAHALLFQ